ncbi:MAG: retropepsin-like aspartic protease [Vicinamibacterales bacterium]
MRSPSFLRVVRSVAVVLLGVFVGPPFADGQPWDLPLTGTPGTPVVLVRVNGIGPLPFLVDTGSSHTTVTSALAREIEAPRVAKTLVSTSAGSDWAAVVRIGQMEVGPVRVTGLLATELPSDRLASELGIAGVLGLDLLGQHPFTIDFRARRLRWGAASPDTFDATLSLDVDGTVWRVLATHQGRTVWLVPDSAAEGLVLFNRGQWKDLVYTGGTSGVQSVTAVLPGRAATLPSLNLGALRFVDQDVVVVNGSGVDPAHGDALLPLHLFSRVAFDPVAGLVRLSLH